MALRTLPPMDTPLFEHLQAEEQSSNYDLWRAYSTLRIEACIATGDDRPALAAQRLRKLRDNRHTWFGREEMNIRYMVDAALAQWDL